MKAIINYKYSTLDNQHEVFISCCHNWVWFHLGAMLQKEGIKQKEEYLTIYPFILSDKATKTIERDDCGSVAKEIVRYIKKKLKV